MNVARCLVVETVLCSIMCVCVCVCVRMHECSHCAVDGSGKHNYYHCFSTKCWLLFHPIIQYNQYQLLSVLWPLDLANFFISQSFSLCRSFSPRSSMPVSVNKPPSVLAAWQAFYRHSKSPHSSSLTTVSGEIIIIIIIIRWWFAAELGMAVLTTLRP